MRRVDSEGDSQSSGDRRRGGSRPSPARRLHLRRLALEGLEARTLLASTLPSPVTLGQSFVGTGITSNAANSSSPSVAIDPLNPNKLVAAWTTTDPANKLDGPNGQVTTYVQGAYSIDGGQTWNELPGDRAADVQTDFSVAPVTSGVQPDFAQTTDATVAFGRDETAYLLTSTHSGTGGVLDLQKWSFNTATPVQGTFTRPAYDSLSPATSVLNPIYRWQAADAALSPTLAVDGNVASFTDGTTTQTDRFSGNVYVAWETQDTAPMNVTQNPNTIKLMSSGDGGQNFTYQAYLNGHGTGHLYDAPKIAISQGSATVPGGQVTIVYDDAGVSTVAPFFDQILTKSSSTGGTDEHADSARNVPIGLAVLNGGGSGVDTPAVTAVPIPVNIADANFNTLQNLTVTLSLSYPNLTHIGVTLTSPSGTTVTLWNTATNAAGTAVNAGSSLTGANVGASTLTPYIGTTLDSTANRSIFDGSATAPYTGHFRPFSNLQTAFAGLTAAQLNGTWTLTITAFRNDTITAPTPSPSLIGASLDFTSGLADITGGNPSRVANSFLNSGAHTFTDGIQAIPVLPNASIASDNTLGSNSPHQGRLYIALTDDNFVAASGAYTTSTFIELYSSDDGGASWRFSGIVNDDNGLTDGFSNGGYAQPGSGVVDGQSLSNPPLSTTAIGANVRPKIEPQVAVDPETGTVVVSFLDTRNDASAVRVANYIAVSDDGGASFAPETFANATDLGLFSSNSPAVDAITGNTVSLGPIPDNQSSGNNNREATFGFGQRQGLAVANGHIIPVWSSNRNAGSVLLNVKSTLNIESAVLTFAAGPRVIASTQGPVGEPGDTVNASRAADGSPIANTIVITFDRAVAPASFPADGAAIGSSPLQVFYNNPSGVGAPVALRVLSVTPDATDTVYTIKFDPAGHGVGSYSYTLRPLVRGMIPYQTVLSTDVAQQVPLIDSAVNSGQAQFTSAGHPGASLTSASIAAMVDIYQKGVSIGSPTDLQIFLVAADNTQYLLFSGTTQGRQANVAFGVNGTISIPPIPLESLDQTYTIRVVDNVPGEKVFLFNNVNPFDFNFQVKLNNSTPTTLTGNLLDQNADGVPGEVPGDDYSVPNGRNSLPLVVSGPHVSSTTVVGVKGTTSTGSDNLVNNDNANSVTVTFDRDMQVSSFTPSQVLSIVGPTGPINGPRTFPSTGTSRAFAYTGVPQFVPKSGTLSSTIPITGTGLKVSSLTVQVSITDPNDSSLALSLVAPDGTTIPLVAAGGASGANFTNTTFGDAPPANGLTSTIAAGAAPYSLTYQPASPLAALAGRALDGTWTLKITDSSASPAAMGRLNSWSLNVTPQVPTGPGTQLNSTLVIPDFPDNSFLISHLAVRLNISSTKDSDLKINLISPMQPNGSQITVPLVASLAANGTNANFANTTFDDNGTIPITSGTAPYGLTYRPSGQLASLNGLSINGTWTLQIIDPNAGGSVTTLNSWSLIATPQITVTPVGATSNGTAARTFKVGFPTQTLSGTYTVTLSPNILSVAPNPANTSMGTPLDTDLNAGVDALRGTSTGPTTTVSYPATAVPVTIPYAKPSPIGPVVNGVLTSQINVPDNFAIQGDVGTLAGLTVSLNISYYNDPDLTATLTSPDGKTITLFMNVGKGANTANFTNTTLSDTTTPLAPITAAGAPFFGTFNPEGPLSGFATDPDGNQAFSKGLWTLTITSNGQDPGPSIDALHPPALLSWSLGFQRPQTNTGLGEPVADQKTASFRLFNLAPSNPLANDTWTAVGPAGTTNLGDSLNANPGGVNLGGPVSVVALDPSDPSGNTAFVGASSGGIWKTTNFLTTSPAGPTYIPITDFGANYSINIGSIAVFARNNDPGQSIVFAGTGDGQATAATSGNAAQGVGFLRSMDGGRSFTLLDSSVNVDANGNPLPINSPLRDHIFVGTTTYKVVVDPTAQPGGGVIVYAALGGANGGLWRTVDGGNHWTNLKAGTATDVLLDRASASPSTGNLDILYAAFQGVGVFISSNQGQSLTQLLGNVGTDPLIQNASLVPAVPLTVPGNGSPNGAFGRIILAKPALTNGAAQNILYQDWLYVAVENTNGTFNGLYVTKDRGENWTKAQIASEPTPAGATAVTEALPTNDNTQANNYDATAGKTITTHNGNSAFSMTVDPLDPNIVYLGGTQDYQTSSLIRVDLTGLYDAHAYVPFANNRNDGGKLTIDSTGRVNVANINDGLPFYAGTSPNDFSQETGDYYLNLRHNPLNPFDANSTLFVFNSSAFTNDGTGVAWQPIDQIYGDPLDGSTNIHQLLTVVDPLTGLTRLIISDDQGVFTGLYNADGSLNTSGIGTSATVTGSRNGNLQDEQLYYSAAQPSALAAQAAGALFYGSGVGMTDAQSAPDLLSTGNLTWTVAGTSYGDVQGALGTNDRGGTGIATDSTGGGVSAGNPSGTPSAYEFDVPIVGGDTTNFFRVNTHGQTTGLVSNFVAEFPANNALYNGVIPLGNFSVNPINGSQVLISSNLGNLYETTNQGVQWLQIGSGSADFDGTNADALTFGAPDPGAPNGIGNLNNFIYAGTVGGHIYMTRTGGGPWTNLSAGLDGSSVVEIYTNPNRGSREAYAVTLQGVYYMADSTASGATWANITGNLKQIQRDPFGDPTLAQGALLGFANGQLGGLRSIVADYRYAIPTSTPLPAVAATGPAAGPSTLASVTSSLGVATDATARLDAGAGNAGTATFNVTLVSSSGAASPYTISVVAPDGESTVLATGSVAPGATATVALSSAFSIASTNAPLNGQYSLVVANAGGTSVTIKSWSLSLNAQSVTNNPVLYAAGYGGVFRSLDNGQTWTAFPNTAFDSAPADGGFLPNVDVTSLTLNLGAINPATGHPNEVAGDPEVLLASTLGRGDFAIRLAPTVFPTTVGLDPTLPPPGGSATGTLNGNPKTNLVHPFISGTSEISNFGNNVTITLVDQATGLVIGTGTTDVFGHFSVQVGDLSEDPSFGADGVKTVAVQATDSSGAKGNVTLFTYVLKTTIPPAAPTGLRLDPSTNTGLNPAANITNNPHPLFDVTGLLPGDFLELFRSTGGSTPVLVGTAAVGATQVRDTAGVPADGVYVYQAVQVSAVGDVSDFSPSVVVTINRTTPAAPTISLVDSDDSGQPLHPNVTNVRSPHFSGTAQFNAPTNFPIVILAVTNGDVAHGIPQTKPFFAAANGTYLSQILGPIADGTYTLVARSENLAGNFSYSAPLTITIKAFGPQVAPTLSILPADDTGIKGDGVTADHSPRFTGKADKGVSVNLYALINGQLSGVQATTTSSTVDGSFTFSLPFNLTDGTTRLVAQAVDIAGNKGPLGAPLTVRIISVAGDYIGSGAAQLTVFDPASQAYFVRGVGAFQADTTPGRDVPVQYDFNGDGKADIVGYRYNSADYFGKLSNGTPLNQQFGPGGIALPVSGYYGTSGTFLYGNDNPNTGVWSVALPQPGGEVVPFGVANVDIPTPAAFDGGGVTEIAYFRPASTVATDRDSFTVATSIVNNKVVGLYRVSFTNTALARFGFVYKPGDIPAPADFDGIGKDEFAIYRPSTGQFFILNTPNINAPSTWTIRTVSLNLPGGPNVNDVPAPEDYDGNGKADFTVYRPSNSTFYVIHSSTGVQESIPFGAPSFVAAAGPLLYRLTALKGSFATTGGFKAATAGTVAAKSVITAGGAVHSLAIASASSSSTSSSSAVPSMVAVASPMVLSTAVPPAPAPTAPAAKNQIVVGALAARAFIPVVQATKPAAAAGANHGKAAKAKKPAKALVVDHKPQAVEPTARAKAVKAAAAPAKNHPAVALAMDKVVKAKKGPHKG